MLVSFRTSLTTYCHLQTFDASAKRNLPFTEKCSENTPHLYSIILPSYSVLHY